MLDMVDSFIIAAPVATLARSYWTASSKGSHGALHPGQRTRKNSPSCSYLRSQPQGNQEGTRRCHRPQRRHPRPRNRAAVDKAIAAFIRLKDINDPKPEDVARFSKS